MTSTKCQQLKYRSGECSETCWHTSGEPGETAARVHVSRAEGVRGWGRMRSTGTCSSVCIRYSAPLVFRSQHSQRQLIILGAVPNRDAAMDTFYEKRQNIRSPKWQTIYWDEDTVDFVRLTFHPSCWSRSIYAFHIKDGVACDLAVQDSVLRLLGSTEFPAASSSLGFIKASNSESPQRGNRVRIK